MEWGGELSKLGNELDSVSTLSFDNYGLGHYYQETDQWDKMLAIFEAVPTPDFHWWNFNMGMAHHYLGNTSKANEYLNIIKPLYGEKPLEKLLEGHLMWNNHLHYTEYFQDILKSKYWKN